MSESDVVTSDAERSGLLMNSEPVTAVDGIPGIPVPQQGTDVNKLYKFHTPGLDHLFDETSIFNQDVRNRLWRYSLIVAIPVGILGVLIPSVDRKNAEMYGLSRYLGIAIAVECTFYFIGLARHIWPCLTTDAYLFKIHTRLGSGKRLSLCHSEFLSIKLFFCYLTSDSTNSMLIAL